MKIIKEFMPAVYEWVDKNLDRGIEKGWLNS
jgi:putative hydrolase of HD superfamily